MKGATLNKPSKTGPSCLPATRRTRAAVEGTSPALFFGAESERSFALSGRSQGLGERPEFTERGESVGRFRICRYGQGRPVVFLHGLGSEMADLRAVADLTGGHRVLVDLPGFGGGTRPVITDLARTARELVAALDKLAIGPALFVGCSFGGHVALRVALDHPSEVAGLVLVSSGGLFPNPPAALGAAFKEETMRRRSLDEVRLACEALVKRPNAATRAFCERRCRAHESGDYSAVSAAATAALADDAACHLEQLGGETAGEFSVDIVHGSADPLVPLAVAEAAAERIHGARLTVLDQAGHMPWLETPDAVAAITRRARIGATVP